VTASAPEADAVRPTTVPMAAPMAAPIAAPMTAGTHGFPIAMPVLSRGSADRSEDLRDQTRIAAAWGTARVLTVDRDGRTGVRTTPDGVTLASRPATDLGAAPPPGAVLLGTVPNDAGSNALSDRPDALSDQPAGGATLPQAALPVGNSPSAGEFPWAGEYAAAIDGVDYWAIGADLDLGELAAATGPETPDAAALRDVGALLSDTDAGLLTAAVAVLNWHRHGSFCPRCGSPSVVQSAGWSRLCSNGHQEFPRTDPAVIVLVHDGADKMVLARQATWPTGRVSVLAGFTEAGESLEGTVSREILEEVGLHVTDIGYLGSQPWPFPRSLMVGFTAKAQPGAPLFPRAGEIEAAQWVDRATVRRALEAGGTSDGISLPPSISIARRMIEGWAALD
jgi:NAD+ diphosphatase